MNPLHASEARTYQRCAREWFNAYSLRRVPLLRPEALTRGTSVHRFLNAFWSMSPSLELPTDPIAKACCLGYVARYNAPFINDALVELPFTTTIGGVECAGTVDAFGIDLEGHPTVVEHKTTSSDISPGSSYWRQVSATDLQVSMYAAAFPGATILYDVIRKPDLEHSQVPLLDDR